MNKPDDIAERVKKMIAEHLGVEAERVTDEADIHDELGADSLDDVELLMMCEEEFGIEIPDLDAAAADTVGDVIKLVRGRLA